MRFSIAWALAAMAYVALAAAAIGTRHNAFVDSVWAVSILAFCYAILVCIASRGCQAFAVGFVVLWVVNAWAVHSVSGRAPASHIMRLAGYDVREDGLISGPLPASPTAPINPYAYYAPVMSTANAVGTMAAGVVGGILAGVAYRRGRTEGE